ncbi:hypothetical protein AVEN_96702-1 [Araneus ventricosus]|uniref:Reverse transcriptase domain-containing protein n=1 Tax=Araneus ventricosus TaxID=182803 RepID=A0A4Y2E7J9_ARAVE|nr:hypothetical protein AVEN_96702-1 [Araneus ventricosus]
MRIIPSPIISLIIVSTSRKRLLLHFDASAKTSTGQSLNSILLNGGSIQDELFSLVNRFRTHKYAFNADIQKMYRQILIEPSRRDPQIIVWKETNNSLLKIYQLNTVTYVMVSVPILAMRVLKALADAEHEDFSEAAKIISRHMHDILSGATSLTLEKKLQVDISELLRRGAFELHKWVSHHPAFLMVFLHQNIHLKIRSRTQ